MTELIEKYIVERLEKLESALAALKEENDSLNSTFDYIDAMVFGKADVMISSYKGVRYISFSSIYEDSEPELFHDLCEMFGLDVPDLLEKEPENG